MAASSPHIAETIALGFAFDPKNNERMRQMDLSDLFASVGKLFDLLDERKVDYVVAGGIAMLAYVEGRNTQDIDLLLSREAVGQLPELSIEDENNDFLRAKFGQLQVDALLTAKQFFSRIAQSHSTVQTFADRKVRCTTPEGLVLLKLFALPSLYRQGNFAKVRIYEGDIEALVDTCGLDTKILLKGLEGEVIDTDLKEIANILSDIEQRITVKRSRFAE
ncbi:hypothetical protein NG895_14655 [Aeoliella sp. ICT_H6.2]|uniref:Uncharacterized protein n=1 Tax=Aeoliella straminimaris TaxID=2954799 RepID=A0A9X2JJM0_9BACT|nr:hypothetical protein [Aeoliella straminimaris]MCO6045149.1 hypothetical protein [Aeoliella straminimaris]